MQYSITQSIFGCLRLSPKPWAKLIFPDMFQCLLALSCYQLSSRSPDKTLDMFCRILYSFPIPNSCLPFLAETPWHLDTQDGYGCDGQIPLYPTIQLWEYKIGKRGKNIKPLPAEQIPDQVMAVKKTLKIQTILRVVLWHLEDGTEYTNALILKEWMMTSI